MVLAPEGVLAIDLLPVAGEGAPYVQFVKSPREVICMQSSPVDEQFSMDVDQAWELVKLGWHPPMAADLRMNARVIYSQP